jgi:hypothetical protein
MNPKTEQFVSLRQTQRVCVLRFLQ